MKIIFLCGSLEAGKDGVGDYTRRLAGELVRQGHSCGIIALMDKFVQESIQEAQQDSEQTIIPVFRLPYGCGYKMNSIIAKEWVAVFNPDWISLQYVPFAYHPKGLPFGLSKSINHLTEGRRLHVMFHELWVGMNKEATPKLKIWGVVQRTMIKFFIKKVESSSIHTQTKLYQWQLNQIDVNSSLLPLFSNIKVIPFALKLDKKKCIHFVVFGTIHPGVPIEDFANSIVQYNSNNVRTIEIIFIGRNGIHLKQWIEVCNSSNINIKLIGEQPSSIISDVLSKADFGIATTPLLTAEKSGTVVAMVEHGLSVLCVSKPWEVKGFPSDYSPFGMQLFKEEDGLYNFLSRNIESEEINSLSHISCQFLDSLES